jgi:hypothetical protein
MSGLQVLCSFAMFCSDIGSYHFPWNSC